MSLECLVHVEDPLVLMHELFIKTQWCLASKEHRVLSALTEHQFLGVGQLPYFQSIFDVKLRVVVFSHSFHQVQASLQEHCLRRPQVFRRARWRGLVAMVG